MIIFNDNEQKYPEPQTRIDFLFYFDNGKVKAVNSEVIGLHYQLKIILVIQNNAGVSRGNAGAEVP